MSAKTASKPVQTAPVRKTPSRATSSKSQASALTHEVVAGDIAAFKKAGGRIEVLGHTPFRSVAPSRSTKPNPPAAAPAASKSS